MTLVATVAAVFIMPSDAPNLSVFCTKGVTRVTYLAPVQGLSRPRAHRSVSPPMLSRIRSNLECTRDTSREKPFERDWLQ